MGVAEQLAEIADRIVDFRVRDAKLDAARRLVERTGSASADEIAAELADWHPPEGQELADLVARKARAAYDVAVADVDREHEARSTAAAKAEKLTEQAQAAHEAAAAPVDESGVAAAQELLDAAIAAGGDPDRAPVGRSVSTTPAAAGNGG